MTKEAYNKATALLKEINVMENLMFVIMANTLKFRHFKK